MKNFAVVHQKGGVGKTTTLAHVAAALAELGQRVLVVDLDPQASLTNLLGCDTPLRAGLIEIIDGRPLADIAVHIDEWNVDLVPAGTDLASVERATTPGVEQRLRRALAEYPKWDVVLVDAPGSLGVLLVSALSAATDGVLIPVTPDYMAMQPIPALTELIGNVQENYQPGCSVAGVVINAKANTSEHTQGAADVAQYFGALVLGTVPRLTAIQEAASAGVPLTTRTDGPAARLRAIYTDIAAQILERNAS